MDHPLQTSLLEAGALLVSVVASLLTVRVFWVPGSSAETQHGRLNSLDGLRGFLALAVVAHHFALNWNFAISGRWTGLDANLFEAIGPAAVVMFFMITGFLFYGAAIRPRHVDWTGLYLKRVFRLVPAYWLAVAFTVILCFGHQGFRLVTDGSSLVAELADWALFTIPAHPPINRYEHTYLIMAGVVWTLRYEWLFYALLPALWALFRLCGKERARNRIAVILAGLLVLFICPERRLFEFDSRTLSPFLLGMLAVELTEIPRLSRLLRSKASATLALALVAAALCLPGAPQSRGHYLIWFLGFLPVAAGNDFFGGLTTRASKLIGDASYSIYLLHGIVLHLLFQVIGVPTHAASVLVWSLLPVVSIAVTCVSLASYDLIERPFIALGRHMHRLGGHVARPGLIGSPTRPRPEIGPSAGPPMQI